LLITLGLVLGLVAATGGVASAATPTLPGGAPAVAAGVTQPTWNNDNHDRDKGRDNGGRDNRGHDNGGWRGGWHPRWWSVSAWQCRKGYGHVDWRHDRCWGGWFSGAHIRRW
jgi:hypothetical protein